MCKPLLKNKLINAKSTCRIQQASYINTFALLITEMSCLQTTKNIFLLFEILIIGYTQPLKTQFILS